METAQDDTEDMVCWYCGAMDTEREHLIAGSRPVRVTEEYYNASGHSVLMTTNITPYICDQCVAFCMEILAEKKSEAVAPAPPKPQGANPHE